MEIPKTWYSHEWKSSKKIGGKEFQSCRNVLNFDRFRRNRIAF